MMDRRRFVAGAVSVLAVPLAARAQGPVNVPRIGPLVCPPATCFESY
jgi:hypothetical protein